MSETPPPPQRVIGLRYSWLSLRGAIIWLYADHAYLVMTLTTLAMTALFSVAWWINQPAGYSAWVAGLFVALALAVYIKKKSVLDSMLAFSAGIFTAFAVNWDATTFTIFAVASLVFVLALLYIGAVILAMDVNTKLSTAASFYGGDFDTSRSTLKQLMKEVVEDRKADLMPIPEYYSTMLLFAFQKFKPEAMAALLHQTALLQAVTGVPAQQVATLLAGVCKVSSPQELEYNLAVVRAYVWEGTDAPAVLMTRLQAHLNMVGTGKQSLRELCTKLLDGE